MRSVGTATQASIDAGIYQIRTRVSVWDEAGVEYPIPYDAIKQRPRVTGDLDTIGWRATLMVNVTDQTAGLFLRGRTIQSWEIFAVGEDISLFRGEIVDVKTTQALDKGIFRETYQVEVAGVTTRPLEAHFTRYEWAPPGDDLYSSVESGAARMTGIVRQLTLTIADFVPAATSIATTGACTSTSIPVTNSTPFVAGDTVFIYKGHFIERSEVSVSAGNVLTLKSDMALTEPTYFPTGSLVIKSAALIPLMALLYFGTNVLEDWITIRNHSGSAMTKTTQWQAAREQKTGALMIVFHADPGIDFQIDLHLVDRWVLLSRRLYHNGTSNALATPYYYILSGIANVGGDAYELLGDQTASTVRADKTHTSSEVWLPNPAAVFASDSATDRWLSVWVGATEYRGKVSSVDKTGGANHGRVLFDASYPLRSSAGATPTLAGGETTSNTGTWYHEILNPKCQFVQEDPSHTYQSGFLRPEPMGGYFLLGLTGPNATWVMPGYLPIRDAGTGDFEAESNAWRLLLLSELWVIKYGATTSDVAKFFSMLLEDCGVTPGDITLAATGYTLAPFTRSQLAGGSMLEEVRKATVPPHYRIRETEAGLVVGGYVTQKGTADLDIGRVSNFAPRELPKPYTRVIVKGKENLVNRAPQMHKSSGGVVDKHRLFDGFRDEPAKAAYVTGVADVFFVVPASEPGRYPIVAKVVISHSSEVQAWVAGLTSLGAVATWTRRGIVPNDATEKFNRREFTELEPVATGATNPYDSWILDAVFEGDGYVDEIQVFVKEGAYWEAALTNDTSKATADGAGGASDFGATWQQPTRSLAMSYRFAPTAFLKRSRASYAKGLDRVLVLEFEGVTRAQARSVAEATLDAVLRGAEFFEATATYDPRVQLGDTVTITYRAWVAGVSTWVKGTFLVWGIVKEGKTMRLTLANYAR